MSFLRKLRGDERTLGPESVAAATSEGWAPGQFARASGDRVDVRFHDAAEAMVAADQLRDLLRQWQDEKRDLAAAYAEEMTKHAAIMSEMKSRQAGIDLVVERIDGALAQVEAYARRHSSPKSGSD
jgi:soluble cytochrome b562